MSLTDKDIDKLSVLARIRLGEDEKKQIKEKLNQILGWVEQLRGVDTEAVPAMAGVGNQILRMRDDKVTDGNIKDDVLANAPSSAYDCFIVPKVIE